MRDLSVERHMPRMAPTAFERRRSSESGGNALAVRTALSASTSIFTANLIDVRAGRTFFVIVRFLDPVTPDRVDLISLVAVPPDTVRAAAFACCALGAYASLQDEECGAALVVAAPHERVLGLRMTW